MYGTVMIARLKDGAGEQFLDAADRWLNEVAPGVPGFLDEWELMADDGSTVVVAVKFRSREEYQALARNPDHTRFWQESFQPLFAAGPSWIVGTWEDMG